MASFIIASILLHLHFKFMALLLTVSMILLSITVYCITLHVVAVQLNTEIKKLANYNLFIYFLPLHNIYPMGNLLFNHVDTLTAMC